MKTDVKQTATGKFAPGNKVGKQFAKGVSGNLNGRPKLTKLTEALREQLAEEMPNAPERTVAELIARTLIKLALSGDVAAIKEVGNRTEGLPRQSLDLDIQATNWRDEARKYGINESEVAHQARLLLAEFDDAGSDEASD
jgi:hypothetical protein